MAFKKKPSGDSGDAEKFKFEKVGDMVEGHLVQAGTITLEDKDVMKYVVQKEGGERVGFLGSFKLDEGLKGMPLGTMIRVTYIKKERLKGGKTLKMFDIEYDDENVIEV